MFDLQNAFACLPVCVKDVEVWKKAAHFVRSAPLMVVRLPYSAAASLYFSSNQAFC